MLHLNVRITKGQQLTPSIQIKTRLVGVKVLFTWRYSSKDHYHYRHYIVTLGLWFGNLELSWSKDTKGE